MGRLEGQLRMVLYQVTRLIPYKYRKPIIAISMILGLFAFLNFMIHFTNSIYLLTLKDFINAMIQAILNLEGGVPIMIICILIISYLCYRNWYSFRATISLMYIAIVFLACLPYFLKV